MWKKQSFIQKPIPLCMAGIIYLQMQEASDWMLLYLTRSKEPLNRHSLTLSWRYTFSTLLRKPATWGQAQRTAFKRWDKPALYLAYSRSSLSAVLGIAASFGSRMWPQKSQRMLEASYTESRRSYGWSAFGLEKYVSSRQLWADAGTRLDVNQPESVWDALPTTNHGYSRSRSSKD